MNSRTWKISWRSFARVQSGETKDLEALSAIIEFVAYALASADKPDDRLSAEEIEELMLASELDGIRKALPGILAENGIKPEEAQAAADESAETAKTTLTEISTGLSSVSLPALEAQIST